MNEATTREPDNAELEGEAAEIVRWRHWDDISYHVYEMGVSGRDHARQMEKLRRFKQIGKLIGEDAVRRSLGAGGRQFRMEVAEEVRGVVPAPIVADWLALDKNVGVHEAVRLGLQVVRFPKHQQPIMDDDQCERSIHPRLTSRVAATDGRLIHVWADHACLHGGSGFTLSPFSENVVTVLCGMVGPHWVDKRGVVLLPQDWVASAPACDGPFELADPLVTSDGATATGWDGRMWVTDRGPLRRLRCPVIAPVPPLDEARVATLLERVPPLLRYSSRDRSHTNYGGVRRDAAIDQELATKHLGVRLPDQLLFDLGGERLCPVGAFLRWYGGMSTHDVAVLHAPERVSYEYRIDALVAACGDADRRLWAMTQAGDAQARSRLADRVESLGDPGRASLLRAGLRAECPSTPAAAWPVGDGPRPPSIAAASLDPATSPAGGPEEDGYIRIPSMRQGGGYSVRDPAKFAEDEAFDEMMERLLAESD